MTILPHILAAQSWIDQFFLPKPASNLAGDVDWTWNFILAVTFIFFCVVVGAAGIFVIKFRRRHPNQKTSTVTHNTPLEIIWTVVPLIIVLAFFYIGFRGFLNYDTPPSDATKIQVVCHQWGFLFTYPNGASDTNLYIMKGEPIALEITSTDVLHAVYIPAFRTQRNAIPGRTTQIWFIATMASDPFINVHEPGGYDIFCTQYCGTGHSTMHSLCYVYDTTAEGRAAYAQKMSELANPFRHTDADKIVHFVQYKKVGEAIYTANCSSCHTVDGTRLIGPTWKGLYKSPVAFSSPPGTPPMEKTDSDAKWDAYLEESILHPAAKIVDGYPNQMSDFTAIFTGSEVNQEKLRAVMEYIRSLGPDYKEGISPEKNPELFIATSPDQPHPESLAYKNKAATQPATTQSK